jgi:hypothetical protein
MPLTTIATYETPALAHVAKSRLVDEEIPCFIADEHIIGMNMFLSVAVGGVKLQVPQEHAGHARAILNEGVPTAEEAVDRIEDVCAVCGSASFVEKRYTGLLALITFLFFGHPFALAQHSHQCLVCGHVWDPYQRNAS